MYLCTYLVINEAKTDLKITEVFSMSNPPSLKMIQKVGRYLQDIDVATVSGREEREEISEPKVGEKRVIEVLVWIFYPLYQNVYWDRGLGGGLPRTNTAEKEAVENFTESCDWMRPDWLLRHEHLSWIPSRSGESEVCARYEGLIQEN